MSHDPSAIATWANVVTVGRVMVSPVLFALITGSEGSWVALALWVVLCASDGIDGRLARRYGSTRSGAFLDPLADKILVLGGVGVMCYVDRFTWVAWVLIAVRELAVSLLRSAYVRRGLAIPASKMAKYKTFLQLGAVGWVTLPLTTD